MKYSLHDIDLIERYFENKLSDEETWLVQDRLEKDTEFNRLFQQEKLLTNAIRFQAAKENLNFLKQIEFSLAQNRAPFIKRYWHYFAAAACLSLVALSILVPSGKTTPDQLFATYFKPHPNIFEPVVRGGDVFSVRAQAFQAYDQEDYYRASTLFSTLLEENKEPEILMLLGNANLMLEKTTEAKQNFEELLTSYDLLDPEAKWYLALCYLKTEEVDPARKMLKEIAGSENAYTARARKLLKSLRQ